MQFGVSRDDEEGFRLKAAFLGWFDVEESDSEKGFLDGALASSDGDIAAVSGSLLSYKQ